MIYKKLFIIKKINMNKLLKDFCYKERKEKNIKANIFAFIFL